MGIAVAGVVVGGQHIAQGFFLENLLEAYDVGIHCNELLVNPFFLFGKFFVCVFFSAIEGGLWQDEVQQVKIAYFDMVFALSHGRSILWVEDTEEKRNKETGFFLVFGGTR